MNAITLAITTMSLGVMVGITATHYVQVDKLVEQGESDRRVPAEAPYYEQTPASPATGKPVTLAASDIAETQKQPMVPMMIDTGKYRDDRLLELLTAMRAEQQVMRKQIAESNRDLDELTFRVDTHSDSFKPLRTDAERPRPLENAPIPLDSSGSGLLPPKQ